MVAGRMLLFRWCLFSCAFLQLCGARIIDCTGNPFSPYSDQTIYGISDVSRVSDVQAEAPNCVYSWEGKQVLAHHKQSDPVLVVSNSINDLITSECFDRVTFTRHCNSEAESYTAYCTTNCTLNALRRSQRHKVIVIAAIVAFLVLLGLCAGVLCYIFRDKISSSRPVRWIYTTVKTQNVDPNAADQKAGESVESRPSSEEDLQEV